MAGEAFRLEGRVVDEHGRPVADARVRLSPGRLSVTTADDGTFVCDGLAAGRFALSAHKDDLYALPLFVGPEDATAAVIVRMQLGTTLVVRAYANRTPVAGAKLLIDGVSATTDSDGIAIIRGLSPRWHRGWLVADGFCNERISQTLHDDPGGIVERFITLRPGARLEGIVRGRDGDAIPDAWVCFTRDDGSIPYEGVADVDGKWHVVAGAGRYRVHVQSNGHWHQAVLDVDCDGRTPRSDIELLLDPSLGRATDENSTHIAGLVVDDRGEPVVGAEIAVAEPSQFDRGIVMRNGITQTDARGRFEVNRLPPGDYEVVASWPEHYGTRPNHRARQVVRAGATNITIALSPGTVVSGRVLLDGHPMSYFGVSLTPHDVSGGTPLGFRGTDGRFALPHVEPGTWRVCVIGPGTRRKVIGGITTTDGQHVELGDLAMERGHRIDGHVRDEAGAPVKDARVVIGHWGRSGEHESSRLAGWFFGRFDTTTDANGAYVFDGVDADLAPRRAAYIWAVHHRAGSSVIRELSVNDATIDFTLLGAGRIEGNIQGLRSGHAMALAVRSDEPRSARMARVERDGRFQFEDLPPGDYVVRSTAPDSEHVSHASVTVVANETANATLVLSATTIRLTLIVPPETSRHLVIEPLIGSAKVGGRMRSVMAMGTEDHCSIDYVRPGDYRVSLDGETWTTITVDPAPETQTIDLRRP